MGKLCWIFFYFFCKGLVHYHFIPECKTVNKEMYIDILCHLRDAVRRKIPEEWRMNSGLFLRKCPSTPFGCGEGFLSNEQCDSTRASSILSWPGCIWFFYLFTWLKSALKGQCFCDATDVIENMTEELEGFSQDGFQECFQHLYSHWQKCIFARGDHFEGNVAKWLYCFVFLKNKVISGAF